MRVRVVTVPSIGKAMLCRAALRLLTTSNRQDLADRNDKLQGEIAMANRLMQHAGCIPTFQLDWWHEQPSGNPTRWQDHCLDLEPANYPQECKKHDAHPDNSTRLQDWLREPPSQGPYCCICRWRTVE